MGSIFGETPSGGTRGGGKSGGGPSIFGEGKGSPKLSPSQRAFIASASGHHGFLERTAHALGRDIVATGEEFPTGLASTLNAAYAANPIDPSHFGHVNLHPAAKMGKAFAHQVGQDVRHPLRHPGFTALDLLGVADVGATSGLRLAAAGRALGEAGTTGAKAAEVARALKQNPTHSFTRSLTVPGEPGQAMTVPGIYSRSGVGLAGQKVGDALIQKAAKTQAVPRVAERAENLLHRRAAKWETRAEKVRQTQLKAEGTRLAQLAKKAKLTDSEQRALRIVAETVPYDRVEAATASRLRDAERDYSDAQSNLLQGDLTGPAQVKAEKALRFAEDAIRGHEARLQWTHDAAQHLAEDAEGRPVFKPEETRLQGVYDAMVAASKSREGLLLGADLTSEEQLANAIKKQGRMAAGAKYVRPTPGRLGKIKGYDEAVKRVAKLEARFQRRVTQTRPTGFGAVQRPRTADEAAARLDDLEREHNKALDTMAQAKLGPIDMNEVRRRNAENERARLQAAGLTRSGKLSGASGRKSIMRPNLKDERRTMMEQDVQDAIGRNPDHPTLQRWKARSDEIEHLRDQLTTSPEEAFGNGARAPRDYGTVSEFRADHPSVLRLGGALSIARDDLERLSARRDAQMMPTGLVGAEDVVPGENAIHVGSPVKPAPYGITGRVSSSRTLGHTRNRGSLKQATGAARQYGMERNDVAQLLAERQHEAVGLSSLARTVERVKPAGRRVPRRPDDAFMWTDGDVVSSARVHPDVRDFLQGRHDPEADPLEAEALKDGGATEAMKQAIFELPNKGTQLAGKVFKPSWELDPLQRERLEAAAAEGKGVFVPRRLLGDRVTQQTWKLNPKLQKATDKINNAGRLGLIYLKVNYPIVQGLSNLALNLVQQGVYAPKNLLDAARLGRKYGPDLSAMIDDAVEQGFAGTVLKGQGRGALSNVTGKIAHGAGLVADKLPRRASWIHAARQMGYTSPKDVRALLTDPAKLPDLIQVTQRAKEAIVDFGDLGPVERDFIRNLVFVYPWVKGSTKYAGHFLRDHPIQAAALGNLGQQGEQINQAAFGNRPTYDMGLLPIGNRAIDLQSLNPFGTPIELGRSAVGLAVGNKMAAEPAASYFSPALGLATQLATGRDSGGFPLKGNLLNQLRTLEVTQTPASQLITSLLPGAKGVLGKPIPSKSFPNQNIPLHFLLGGLSPRVYDRGALNASAGYQTAQR